MTVNNVILTVLVVAFLFDSFYQYLTKNKPDTAKQLESVDLLARWAVSLFDTVELSNGDKQAKATKAVLDQAKKSKIKLTEDAAKGAVEKAVAERRVDKPVPTVGFTATETASVTEPDQPASDLMEVTNVE